LTELYSSTENKDGFNLSIANKLRKVKNVMTQEKLLSSNEEQIQIQKQRLELAKEEFELEKQKKEWEYEQKIKDLDLEQKQVQFYSEQQHREFTLKKDKLNLENQVKETSAKLKGYIAAGLLKSITSVLMICAGIYFTSIGNNIGPFIMGTGATGVGIETTKILKGGGKENEMKETRGKEEIQDGG
jgi:hypothetical protein